MKPFTYALRSKDLTADARRIFGDFVEEALFCNKTYDSISGDDATRLIKDAEIYDKGDDIDIPTAGSILLILVNKNKVCISTSEWGSISSVTDKVVIIQRNEETIDH